MKTKKWKRSLSVVLAGAMVMTSLSTAMTAFAAETEDTPEYTAAINAAVEAAKSDAFDYVTGTSVYDDKWGHLLAYAENYIKATVELNKQDSETYADVLSASKAVTADIQEALTNAGEKDKAALVDKFDPSSKFTTLTIYAWGYGDATRIVDVTTPDDGYTTYKYSCSKWPSLEFTSSVGTISAVNYIKTVATAIENGFLTKDLSSMTFDELNTLYGDNYSAINYAGKYPSFWLLDLADQLSALQQKLNEVGEAASKLVLDEVKEFLEKYPDASAITADNYNEYRDAFDTINDRVGDLHFNIENAYQEEAENSLKTWKADAMARAVTIVVEEAAKVVEAYGAEGEKVTAENVAAATEAISAVNTIFNDTTFGYVKWEDEAKAAVATMDPIQAAADFINGDGAGFINSVSELKAQYTTDDSFTVPVDKAVEVNAKLAELKAKYDSMAAGVKAREDIKAAYADYEMMVAAVADPYFTAILNDYQAAVDEMKADWFDGENVKAITMKDFTTVSAVLANLDSLYARFNDEQKEDEAVVAAYAAHTALQAAYDASLNSADSYVPSEFTYPEGLNEENVAQAIQALDTVINNPQLIAMLGLGTDSLGKFVTDNVYSDAAVTLVVKTVFPLLMDLLGDSASMAGIVGINVTPSNVAKSLGNYPSASAAFTAAGGDWNAVDWNAVSWGVETGNADQFYAAVGANMEGIQKVLAALLANSPMTGLVKIAGVEGYALTIVPLLTQLGCESIATVEEFKADTSATAMLRKVVEPIVNRVVDICSAPVEELTALLPQVAYFLTADGLKQILSPLVIDVSGFATLKVDLWETLSASVDLSDLNALLSGLITGAVPNFKWVDIDFGYVAGLGSAESATDLAGNPYVKVTADTNKVTVVLLQYVGEVLNVNADLIKGLIPTIEDPDLAAVVTGLLDQVLAAAPEDVATMLIHLLVPTCDVPASEYNYPEIAKGDYVYPEGVVYGDEAYGMLPSTLDGLLTSFGLDLSTMVTDALYTDDLINQVFGLYDTIRANETVAQVVSLLGIDVSEETIASLKEQAGSVTDKASFINALTTALSPFDDVLAFVLAGQDFDLLGVNYTSKFEAYNTAVVPLLEALGCTDVTGYADYQAAVAGGESPLKAILTQVLDRLDEILTTPVDSIVSMLPNLAYFLDSNNLSVVLENLVAPLSTLLAHMDVDLMAVIDQLLVAFDLPKVDDIDNDLATLLNKVLGMIEVNGAPLALTLPNIDLHALASYGTAETYTSAVEAAAVTRSAAQATRIVADKADVTGAVLDYLYQVLSDETNMNTIVGLLGDYGEMVSGILESLMGSGIADFTNSLFGMLNLPMLEYTVTVVAGENGTVTPGTGTVVTGGTVELTVQADDGYIIDKMLVNGEEVPQAAGEASYVWTTAVTSDITVEVTFAEAPTEPTEPEEPSDTTEPETPSDTTKPEDSSKPATDDDDTTTASPDTTEPATDSDNTQGSDSNVETGDAALAAVAGAALLAAGAVIVLAKKRK